MKNLERLTDEMPSDGVENNSGTGTLPTDEEIHADEFRAYLHAKGVPAEDIEPVVLYAKETLRAMEAGVPLQ